MSCMICRLDASKVLHVRKLNFDRADDNDVKRLNGSCDLDRTYSGRAS